MGFFKSIKLTESLLETVVPERNVHERDRHGRTPLLYATVQGDLQTVQWLVHNTNADINARDWWGMTALNYAAESGHLDIVKLLVEEKGGDINEKGTRGWTILSRAARGGAVGHCQMVG